jgi:hypothetical protein
MDVLAFFFLDKGCQQYRAALYQSMGVLVLDGLPDVVDSGYDPMDMCSRDYTLDEAWDGINLIEEGATRNQTVTVRE